MENTNMLANKKYSELMILLNNIVNILESDRQPIERINKAKETKKKVFNELQKRVDNFKEGEKGLLMDAEGVLSAFNYRVGDFGISSQSKRLSLLKLIIESPIPPIKDLDYIEEWGQPSSPKRLSKLKNTLIGLASNRKKQNNPRWRKAIGHWEHDFSKIRSISFQF